jgi:hypothetical protein
MTAINIPVENIESGPRRQGRTCRFHPSEGIERKDRIVPIVRCTGVAKAASAAAGSEKVSFYASKHAVLPSQAPKCSAASHATNIWKHNHVSRKRPAAASAGCMAVIML